MLVLARRVVALRKVESDAHPERASQLGHRLFRCRSWLSGGRTSHSYCSHWDNSVEAKSVRRSLLALTFSRCISSKRGHNLLVTDDRRQHDNALHKRAIAFDPKGGWVGVREPVREGA